MTKKILVTLTGASGSGKTTLLNRLVDTGKFSDIVSHTTRAPRPGEVDGKSYHFVTPDKFDQILNDNGFMEHVKFNGVNYGVSRAEADKVFKDDKFAVLIVEPNGLIQINKYIKSQPDFELLPIHVVQTHEVLVERYLARMDAEDLAWEEKRMFHTKRLISIAEELKWFSYEHKSKLINSAIDVTLPVNMVRVVGTDDTNNQLWGVRMSEAIPLIIKKAELLSNTFTEDELTKTHKERLVECYEIFGLETKEILKEY